MKTRFVSKIAVCLAALTLAAPAQALTTSYDCPVSVAGEIALSDDLVGIVLTDVPTPYQAQLNCGSRTLGAGDVVTAGQLSQLYLMPMVQADVTAEIGYIPVFADAMGSPATVSVGIFSKKNSPPTADDLSLKTYKGIAITDSFKAQDPDGDELTFEITGSPKRGTVELGDCGTFTYTPEKNKVGKDSFTYTAADSNGNVSEQAKVEIEIVKPTSKLTYADMVGDPACYAAMRLSEAGVYTGEQLGGKYYFRPDELVTRGEFLAMTLQLTGIESDAKSVTTGFADDDTTPGWVKPYITTALKNGIISGVTTTSGSLVFRSEAYLTMAEAAVIIDNAVQLSSASTVTVMDEAVPAWAVQAAANLDSAGILRVDTIGNSAMGNSVTRAEAAKLLSAVMDVMESGEKDKGLLSWVFE